MEDSMSYHLSSEVTHHHFQHSLLVTEISSIHCGRGLYKSMNTKRLGSLGPSLRLTTIFCPFASSDAHLSNVKHIHFHLRSPMSQLITTLKYRILSKSGLGVDGGCLVWCLERSSSSIVPLHLNTCFPPPYQHTMMRQAWDNWYRHSCLKGDKIRSSLVHSNHEIQLDTC